MSSAQFTRTLQDLTEINLNDLVHAFAADNRPLLAQLIRLTFRGAARKFARKILAFDAALPADGLVQAARHTLSDFVREVRIHGAKNLPRGGCLFLSNHPGMTDALALFCGLGREDLNVIALPRPFLATLPSLRQRLFFVPEDTAGRVSMIRRVSSHLRNGGAALTFPAGRIEPDPAVYPGSVESLAAWTESAEVFLRLAPQIQIVPIVVRHVISENIALHPALRIQRDREARERLAAALQLLANTLFSPSPITVHVQIGRPIGGNQMAAEAGALHKTIIDSMQSLIENPPLDEGVCVL